MRMTIVCKHCRQKFSSLFGDMDCDEFDNHPCPAVQTKYEDFMGPLREDETFQEREKRFEEFQRIVEIESAQWRRENGVQD